VLKSILISGGGTGGHIFPALAIGQEIRLRNPESAIHFVGALGKMEMEKIPLAGFSITGLPIAGLQRSLSISNLQLPFKMGKSLQMALALLKQHRPQAAVGVGGYASGPLLLACRLTGVPYLIQEQNSHAGLTNRWLGSAASSICVAYPGMSSYFPANKIKLTGNPVRKGYEAAHLQTLRSQAFSHFNMDPSRPTVFITGGSLGARTINQAVENSLSALVDQGYQLIWQTGLAYFEKAQAMAATSNRNRFAIYVAPFIPEMALAYAAASLVVARAGALTISELCLAALPAILIPSPNVAEDHQTRNAQALVNRNAAILLPDSLALANLGTQVASLLSELPARAALSSSIQKLAFPAATKTIVDILETVAKPTRLIAV
jgi:UDP-N-acetylglucosamine--N-acetylmuramyl-(pentapeptide) pyrophosphoryl-undecaprenol N-acetylglucosamine transferase